MNEILINPHKYLDETICPTPGTRCNLAFKRGLGLSNIGIECFFYLELISIPLSNSSWNGINGILHE